MVCKLAEVMKFHIFVYDVDRNLIDTQKELIVDANDKKNFIEKHYKKNFSNNETIFSWLVATVLMEKIYGFTQRTYGWRVEWNLDNYMDGTINNGHENPIFNLKRIV